MPVSIRTINYIATGAFGTKRSLIASVVLVFIVITFSSNTDVVFNEKPELAVSQNTGHQMALAYSYTPHDPITITSNADFAAQGWPGNGTSGNPYVIEGLNITADAICISIKDTTVFFVVKDCVISSGIISSTNGIDLDIVANGTIQDSIIDQHLVGIVLFGSVSCNITSNTVSSNSHNGIHLYNSDNCTLTNNTASSNSHSGFYLESSNNCTLTNNTASSNSHSGFYLYVSDNCCTLINNTASRNVGSGFSLYGWGICALTNNTAIDNFGNGFLIDSVENSTILLNSASNNLDNGFYLHALENCNLTLNTVSNNARYGILIMCGFSGIISNNTLVNNGLVLENFLPSEVIKILYNTVNQKPLGYFWNTTSTTINANHYGQIILANCADVLVKDGVFINTSNGIHLFSSNNCMLTNNTISNNSRGISLAWSCNNCTLMNNTVSNNSIGIFVTETCEDNTFYLNRFVDNEENAHDNGDFNSWDDGISLGNYWSNYNGTGTYLIPGVAGSVDNYPLVWEPVEPTSTTTTTSVPGDTMLTILLSGAGIAVVIIVIIVVLRKRKL